MFGLISDWIIHRSQTLQQYNLQMSLNQDYTLICLNGQKFFYKDDHEENVLSF